MTGRPLTIIGAVLAVVSLAAFLFFGRGSGAGTPASGVADLRPVVVAANDIGLRVPISLADVKVVRMAADAVPPESFQTIDQVKNLIPVANIIKGQAVTANLVVSSDDQISPTQAAFLPIPPGFVALTIPTSEQQGVAGYINPGDYISMIAVLNPGGKFQNSRTVYTNVHVIRVGPATSDVAPVTTRQSPGTPTAAPAARGPSSSLTIVVTVCQAEFINWFITNGSLKYVLEAHSDYRPQDSKPDPACASVESSHGVTTADVKAKFPELLANAT